MAHGVVTPGGVVPGIILADTSALYYLRASHTESLYHMETRIRGPFLGVGIGHRVHSRGDSRSVPSTPISFPVGAHRVAIATDLGNVTQALLAIYPTHRDRLR